MLFVPPSLLPTLPYPTLPYFSTIPSLILLLHARSSRLFSISLMFSVSMCDGNLSIVHWHCTLPCAQAMLPPGPGEAFMLWHCRVLRPHPATGLGVSACLQRDFTPDLPVPCS